MLADCTFFLPKGSFSPFARAPWMGTVHDPAIIGHLRELGGDFVCVPFGAGGHKGYAPPEWASLMDKPPLLPIHGPAGDREWTIVSADAAEIVLSLDYPEDSPVERLERVVAVRPDAPALDFTLRIHARQTALISVGLHPIMRLPDELGHLALSADFAFGLTHPAQTAPGQRQEFSSLSAVPQPSGEVDLGHPPLAAANVSVQLCGMRGPLTATYLDEGAGVELDWDRSLLPSLQIWYTDRGIQGAPWNGQFRGIGLEPIASAFDLNNGVSIGPNPINQRGIPTAVQIHAGQATTIRHSVLAFSS
jgi:hypothetical protein